MLELKLFGIPELSWEGEPLSSPSPKNLAILSYLALSPESISRKDLTELFWQDGKAFGLIRALDDFHIHLRHYFLHRAAKQRTLIAAIGVEF